MEKEFRIEYVIESSKSINILYLESQNEEAVRIYAEDEIEFKHSLRKGMYRITSIQEAG